MAIPSFNNHLVGVTAPLAYSAIIAQMLAIEAVSFASYSIPPLIQDRASLEPTETQLVDKAAELRKDEWFSYLEVLLNMIAREECDVTGILNAIEFHQPHPSDRVWLSRRAILEGKLVALCNNAVERSPIAVFSRIRTKSGEDRHIPLLDFHVEKRAWSLSLVVSIGRKLTRPPFLIMETSRSYHLVGTNLLPESELMKFLAKSLLYSPIVDHAYVAHQIIEGESALRITTKNDENDIPVVAAFVT